VQQEVADQIRVENFDPKLRRNAASLHAREAKE
jgi:hypothetical protein